MKWWLLPSHLRRKRRLLMPHQSWSSSNWIHPIQFDHHFSFNNSRTQRAALVSFGSKQRKDPKLLKKELYQRMVSWPRKSLCKPHFLSLPRVLCTLWILNRSTNSEALCPGTLCSRSWICATVAQTEDTIQATGLTEVYVGGSGGKRCTGMPNSSLQIAQSVPF